MQPTQRRHCEEREQRSNPVFPASIRLDCFAALAMTSLLWPHFFHLRIAWKIVGALAIDRVHHHALAVLQGGLADKGAERRLMIDLAEGDLAERRGKRQSLGRRNQLLRICRVRLGENGG